MDIPGHLSSPVSVALMTSLAARNRFHSVVPVPAAGVVGVAAAGVGDASNRSNEDKDGPIEVKERLRKKARQHL